MVRAPAFLRECLERPFITSGELQTLSESGDEMAQAVIDDEHVQREPDLAREEKRRHARRRKQPRVRRGQQGAEEGRAEQNPREHLADHSRLERAAAGPCQEAAGGKDHGRLKKEDHRFSIPKTK